MGIVEQSELQLMCLYACAEFVCFLVLTCGVTCAGQSGLAVAMFPLYDCMFVKVSEAGGLLSLREINS
jgi:hypothetical protein